MPGLTHYYSQILGHDLTAIRYIDEDFVGGKLDNGGGYHFAFGDPVIPLASPAGQQLVRIVGGTFNGLVARCKAPLPLRNDPVLRFSMIDVQQGDGMVIETPGGRIILIDGGDNQLFARHLAARFAGTASDKRLLIDGIIVTHGDADHFEGLVEIRRSETITNTPQEPNRKRKRLFIEVDRVFHNGLAKRPEERPNGSKRKDVEMFGATVPATPTTADETFCVELIDDLLTEVGDGDLNRPFRNWRAALAHWNGHRPITMTSVNQNRAQAIKNLFEQEADFGLDLHGPIAKIVSNKPRLLFLRAAKKAAEMHLSDAPAVTSSFSASHTVNGHSITFRLRFKNVRFLLTGDLNQQAMARLRAALPSADFECEILKAPHHGSHDFDFQMLKQAKPVVSLISSGDESEQHEHIHPRATLLSALGRVSRGSTGIIFITELAAFFKQRGVSKELDPEAKKPGSKFDPAAPFFAFERTNFGIVHIRTDGKRVLAFTHSGKAGVNEGYGFNVAADHDVTFRPSLAIRTAPQ
jgi:beta-lactamase superfamily II metal-dependent hydrolase